MTTQKIVFLALLKNILSLRYTKRKKGVFKTELRTTWNIKTKTDGINLGYANPKCVSSTVNFLVRIRLPFRKS